jgi:NAD(P)-dependent dehydrogenase (short-subunit alcohol dehydrogenase family)
VRALVTGASRGLGLGLCAAYRERGDRVIAVCRRSTPSLDALGAVVVEGVDLARDDAEDRLSWALGPEPVDVVIANAAVGGALNAGLDDADPAAIAQAFQVNALGPLRTIRAALPNLRSGARIALITTDAAPLSGRAARPGLYGYRMSKAALNALGLLLAGELRPRGISVVLLSPGAVDTEMLRAAHRAGRTPRHPESAAAPLEVARDLVARVDELDLSTSGAWLDRSGAPCGA